MINLESVISFFVDGVKVSISDQQHLHSHNFDTEIEAQEYYDKLVDELGYVND